MADFRPETTVYLFRATGVDNDNQPYFTSEGAKMAWYQSHGPIAFTQYTYQRENREYIRVQGKAENLWYYDMMGFQNSDGRWVLCKIEAIEFINPNTTEITYTVDYMQTYIENITFGPCWVEREMQVGDWDGSKPSFNNLQPEGIETGMLTRTLIADDETNYTNFKLIVFSAYDKAGEPLYRVQTSNNYPSGLNALSFDIPRSGRIGGLEDMLELYTGRGIELSSAIAGAIIVPAEYADGGLYTKQIEVQAAWDGIGIGYQPKNAKCFTSEFFKLEISNRRGNEQELKPENFKNIPTISLTMQGATGGGAGGTILYPTAYEGNPLDFGVIRYDDIQVPFVGNAYAAWLSGNMTQMIASVVTSAGGAFMMVPGPAKGVAALAAGGISAANAFAKAWDRAKDPASIGGQTAGNVMDLVLGNYGFSVNWVHPYKENLQSIDEYFGRYGYRTNRFKRPNVDTRPKWNYVKTAGAVCRGPFPKRAQEYMENLMNNGVTFWHLSPGEQISDDWSIDQNME